MFTGEGIQQQLKKICIIGNHNMMNKGLTLVELLVSIGIFGVLVTGLISMFMSAVDAQQSVLQNQELLNQGSYVTEYMDRAIRMALRDDGTVGNAGECTGTSDKNYGVASGSITFLSYDIVAGDYKCKRFILDNNKIWERKSIDTTAANLQSAVEITSSKVKIVSFNVVVDGDVVDTNQPKVTFLISMESNSQRRLNPVPSMIFQTTVSQRNLNISN